MNKKVATLRQGYEEWKKARAAEGNLMTSQERESQAAFQNSWGEKSKTISDYISQSSRYLQNAQHNYFSSGGREEAEKLRSQGVELLNYLGQNSKYMDDESRIEIGNALRDINLGYSNAIRLYSNFKNENDYLKWDAYSTTEGRQARYEQNQKRLEELKGQRQELLSTGVQDRYGSTQNYISIAAGAGLSGNLPDVTISDTSRDSLEEIDKEIASIEAEMRMYERGNTDETGFYYGSKAVDDYSDIIGSDDYMRWANVRNQQNPTREDLNAFDARMDTASWYVDGYGVTRDRLGNVVDQNSPVYADDPRYAINDPLGMYLSVNAEDRNTMVSTGEGAPGTVEKLVRDGYYGNWEQLDEKEQGVYYTLLNTQGKEAALKYLSDMETELNRRNMSQESELYKLAFDAANGWQRLGMSAASVPANLLGGATAFVDDLGRTIRGEDINPYSAAHQMQNYGQQVRQNQAAAFDESSSWEIPWIGFSAGDLYQAAMSTADMFGGAMLGPTAYGALMGMGAASSEARRLYEMGASKDQIFWGSAAAGAAEMVFEKIGLDKLLGIKNVDTLGKAVLAALISGGVVEAGEEGGTELANLITNHLIMTSESDWAKLIEANNGDVGAATWAAIGQIGAAAAGGFVFRPYWRQRLFRRQLCRQLC